MGEILPIRRKTLSNQSINQLINQLINQSCIYVKDRHFQLRVVVTQVWLCQ